ncbi:MAG: bifunctional riboflavin kinase/FAD synthetase [Eubacterium sp.]|jgi:riboflavin kinase/FMN adenylyltransferase|nr:bifunctional riboflavin kinase/FAD synthetase [Eubacterium sp.]
MIEKGASVALGMFDGLHLGHIEVIKAAVYRSSYNPTVFTFNDNSLLPKMKKRENIITYEQKIKLLKSIGVKKIFAPDFIETKNFSPEEFVEKILICELNAKYVTCGYDFRFGKNGKAGPGELKKICSMHNIAAKKIPAVLVNGKAVSSTEIRKLIKSGNIQEANLLLGYDLMYELPVIHGRKLGRNLNIPTINQAFPEGNVMPRPGVYRSWTKIRGCQQRSITNIGFKPTIDNKNISPVIETHLIGFNGSADSNFYGETITVSLIDFIRDEQKFNSIEDLKSQIEIDIKSSLKEII